MMHAPAIELIFGNLGNFFLVLVCIGAFRERLYLRMPVFGTYLTAQVILTIALAWIESKTGLTSFSYFCSYYLKDVIMFSLIGACIFEIASVICRPYIGIRRMVFRALCFCGAISLLVCTVDVLFHHNDLRTIIFILERDVPFAETTLLLVICLIANWYEIFPVFFERYAILGFGLDLLIQWFNYYSLLGKGTFMVSVIVEIGGWNLVLLIWLAGFLRNPTLPVTETQEVFDRQEKRPKGDGTWIDPWEWQEVWAFPYPRRVRGAATLVLPPDGSFPSWP